MAGNTMWFCRVYSMWVPVAVWQVRHCELVYAYTLLYRMRRGDLRYDTIRDAILTCARKPTWVSLIYRDRKPTNIKRWSSELWMFTPALHYCHLRNPDSLTYVLTWFFVPGPGVRGTVQAGISARRWRTMVHFSQPTPPGRKRLSDSVLVSYILPLFFGSFFSRISQAWPDANSELWDQGRRLWGNGGTRPPEHFGWGTQR